MRIVACFVLFLIWSISAYAESDIEKRKSAERLMMLMKADTMWEATSSQVDQMFMSMTKQLGVSDSERPILEKYRSKMNAMMRAESIRDKMKESLIDSYVKHFTQEELADLVTFYETKTGRSMIEKTPLLMKDITQAAQSIVVEEVLPRMQTISQELREELHAARNMQ